MVGKGLEWYIIAELLFYATANLVPMALPLAILLSSIMTFGNLGEHYELAALKSSGLSLWRIMFPLIIVIFLTSGLAFYFSNNVWPVANLKFASLLYDIRHKKPALDIVEGVFYKGIEGYVIRVGGKEPDGQTLHDIIIYDHTKNRGNRTVVRAADGKMEMSEDERTLIITLYNGHNYEEQEAKDYPLFRSSFDENIIRFDLSAFTLERSNEDIFKDNYQMLNIWQLALGHDSVKMRSDKRWEEYRKVMDARVFSVPDVNDSVHKFRVDTARFMHFPDSFNESQQFAVLEAASNITRSAKVYASSLNTEFKSHRSRMDRFNIEWHRKFTLSIACILLFFIGAPLGAIIRKGGLGMPVVVSVFFFILFHISSITGEKLIKQATLEPLAGMWMASAILLPIGMFLTYKATTDSALFDYDTYSKIWRKVFPWKIPIGKKDANSTTKS